MPDAALYVSALLLAATLVYVLSPMFEAPRNVADPEEGDVARAASLQAQKAMVYQSIRDAELDRQTGKLSDEDADAMVTDLKARAVGILKELDGLGSGPAATPAATAGRAHGNARRPRR